MVGEWHIARPDCRGHRAGRLAHTINSRKASSICYVSCGSGVRQPFASRTGSLKSNSRFDPWTSYSELEDIAVSSREFYSLPTRDEALFSVKTFLAGMLALYIAFSIDLSRPYWALAHWRPFTS